LSAWASYHAADLAWRSYRWEAAVEEWTHVWERQPFAHQIPLLPERLAESRYRAAYEASSHKEYEKALAWYAAFADGPPSEWRRRNVSEARLTLDTADCYAGLKQWDKVLELVGQATKQQGADQQEDHALYLEGCAHWGLGHWDAAVHAWQVCLQRYPLTEWGNQVRERIRR
jgi:tetratricopeptide (TPR) repeat protein